MGGGQVGAQPEEPVHRDLLAGGLAVVNIGLPGTEHGVWQAHGKAPLGFDGCHFVMRTRMLTAVTDTSQLVDTVTTWVGWLPVTSSVAWDPLSWSLHLSLWTGGNKHRLSSGMLRAVGCHLVPQAGWITWWGHTPLTHLKANLASPHPDLCDL